MNFRYKSKFEQKRVGKEQIKRSLVDLKAFTKNEFYMLSKKNISVPIYSVTL